MHDENKNALYWNPGKSPYPLSPEKKKTLSAHHVSSSARIELKPRPQVPDGLLVSTYLAFRLKCAYEERWSKSDEKYKNIRIHTRFPFGEWDVSRGVTQTGMPQGKVINRHLEVLVAWGSFPKSATFRDKLALYHFFLSTFVSHGSRRRFVLALSKTFYILTIRDKYHIYTSGENVTFLDTSYISVGMTKAYSKRQQVALEYV